MVVSPSHTSYKPLLQHTEICASRRSFVEFTVRTQGEKEMYKPCPNVGVIMSVVFLFLAIVHLLVSQPGMLEN